ncbi:hypothetical protein DM02DRAFT_395383 [Periconia macrospinosa]|uniref:Uncharacterized protein n=1 Tax=Periconia macrospinosa TaxID=97972 RepID=A0A2V1DQY9_9PLEO|nr:hypothetical protein DM02DRAFT_395383 [Periconia macrospinosa]
MKTELLLLFGFVFGIVAGPVKTECGETCFNSTNDCGAQFGGCWNKCIDQRPTFTAPLCPATVAEAASPTLRPVQDITIVSAAPTITAKPDPNSVPAESGCRSGTTLCIDYVLQCHGRNLMYGGCDDICSSKSYTAPPCSVRPVPTISWRGNETWATLTKGNGKRPPTTRTPCNPAKPRWMCAPLDW